MADVHVRRSHREGDKQPVFHALERLPEERGEPMVQRGSMGVIMGINHVTFAVTDLDRSLWFYVDTLGCRAVARWKRGAYLEVGTLWLCLSLDEGVHATPATGATHVALSVDAAGLGVLRDRLLATGAREWRANRSEGESLYVLDPDGHRIELHVGDLRSRLAACREAPYDGMEILE